MFRIALLCLSCIVLTGCGTARTIVLDPVEAGQRVSSVRIVAHNPTVQVPTEVSSKIEAVLRKGLYEKGPFVEGDELTLQYTFVSHDAGNQFARWFWGGIGNAGEGSVVVMVSYLSKGGEELAKTQVEGRIGSGFFGGSMNEAIAKAGEDIVEFTVSQFGPGG